MKTPRNWRLLKRHPLSAEYEDIGGPTWDAMVKDCEDNGFDNTRPIILAPNEAEGGRLEVGDGWQRQRLAVACDVAPKYLRLPKGMTLEQYIERHNDNRRHETASQRERRIEKRRARVAEARANGKSFREIAEDEGIDPKTAREDVKAAPAQPVDRSTNGRDGKKYPASKPEETKAKAGKPRFNDEKLVKHMEVLTRMIDDRKNLMGKGSLPTDGRERKKDAEELLDRLRPVSLKASRHDRCQELFIALLEEIKLWRKDG